MEGGQKPERVAAADDEPPGRAHRGHRVRHLVDAADPVAAVEPALSPRGQVGVVVRQRVRDEQQLVDVTEEVAHLLPQRRDPFRGAKPSRAEQHTHREIVAWTRPPGRRPDRVGSPAMIAVFGAGSIGCWVGGRLAAGGAAVRLIGRQRVMEELASGLRVTDLDGFDATVQVETATAPEAAASAEIVVVTVKSAATEEVGATLATVLPEGAVVLSLQNGVRNASLLRELLPGRRVLAGMVPFNVIRREQGAYHRGSAGVVMIERAPAAQPFVQAARRANLPLALRDDMAAVQWAKLVLNLNNAVNALSGQPLAAELAQRDFRRCLAAAQREAFAVLAAAKTPVAKLTSIPPRWMPALLGLPDALFLRLARRVVAIDPHARSSMSDDLEARRLTEVDYIQGEIVALAERHGREAPINSALRELVRKAEQGGQRSYTGVELRAALRI